MSSQALGSCEACKKKKCKCDRNLPYCTQCAGTPLSCNYAESNKRGIPGGYLGLLERRLAETENALHNALSELQSLKFEGRTFMRIPGRDGDTPLPILTTKNSRMEEWKKYPLKTADDVEQWWYGVGEGRSLGDSQPPNSQYDGENISDRTSMLSVREQSITYNLASGTNNSSQDAVFPPPIPQTNDEQVGPPITVAETPNNNSFSFTTPREILNTLDSNAQRNNSGSCIYSQPSLIDTHRVQEEIPESSRSKLQTSAERGAQLAQAQRLTRSMNYLYY